MGCSKLQIRMKEGVCELLFMKFWWICLLLHIRNFRSEILVIFVVYCCL
ncbi:hypothetical protein MtrunA17_Chr1g0153311 [Medicago truncatula]|uniref:Uncharacterized protein n=1 Tax=Medicago truncatula TaxID=3880 RepID=A0A396JGF9_MEDTR|nr:hypothetical protein MtrunA17_Chr1g0153311 [Medicago truncatula]